MRNLLLSDLKLALGDLLNERNPKLLLSNSGKLYAPQLAKKLAEIEKLPDALTGGRPLAQDLAETDGNHDGLGEAIYYQAEAILRLPLAPPDLKAKAHRIREAFVPRLNVLRATYATEAAAADKNRTALDTLKDDLAAIPVPAPEGATLLDWATAFVDAGDRLGRLLSDRSLLGSGAIPTQALAVRTTTIGILNRFRAALADEMAHDTSLPRDLDTQVFSFFDELQSTREQSARTGKSPKDEATDKDASSGEG
ncbi:hypothetical protein [Polyangium jinanense]|uniref:Uncharacterized protein n=1 Tax=Polyangium jinanense TaxID=2829994 RepID=A0A9X3X2M7_9BACT|nr:hypothetical protein [Polyangium jinanense]MDC3952687.1 hypothetical protein [Polyangium jinanense]MDC3980306.1 hypothetical protein [Polyangium jinanense]